jgi:phage-related protein
MSSPKPVAFRGSALSDLREFPLTARRDAGHQLDQVQQGIEPDDWKPMNTVGQGVREIRIRDEAGVFRVIYVAKFADAIYVLHCFQKKSQKICRMGGAAFLRYPSSIWTPMMGIAKNAPPILRSWLRKLTTSRYRDLVKELA